MPLIYRYTLTQAELQPFFDALKSRKQDMQSGRRAFHRFDDSTNVYAIALSSSAPYRTKRGDWMVSVLLIDESLPPTKLVNDSNENNSNADNIPANPSAHIYVPSISINIFHPDKSKLPVIRYAGDVIRAHRVAVQEYNGDIQLVGRRNSSFYVVRPRNEKLMMENPQGQGWVESYTASKPSMLDVDDYLRMRDLWRWGRQRFGEHPILHGKERISIADVGPVDDLERAMAGIPIERTVTNGDLIAMVTAIIPQPPEQVSDRTPRAFLRLWDGTGRPESDPILVDSLAARQAIQEGDPPSSVLTAISKIVPTLTKGVGGDGESEGFEPPKCLCGRVVNVAIWEAEQWERIRSNESGIRVGKFVRLKNVNDGRLGAENPKRCKHYWICRTRLRVCHVFCRHFSQFFYSLFLLLSFSLTDKILQALWLTRGRPLFLCRTNRSRSGLYCGHTMLVSSEMTHPIRAVVFFLYQYGPSRRPRRLEMPRLPMRQFLLPKQIGRDQARQ